MPAGPCGCTPQPVWPSDGPSRRQPLPCTETEGKRRAATQACARRQGGRGKARSSPRTPSTGASTGTLLDHVQGTGAANEQVATPPPPPGPTSGSSQGQARPSRVTRRASPPPPARPPYTLTRTPTHTQARRHLPPACASAGYGGRQQSGRPCDRTAGSRPAQSRGAGKDARGGSGRPGEAFTQPNPTLPPLPSIPLFSAPWGAEKAGVMQPC